MKKSGFSALGILLVVIILGIVVFTTFFVTSSPMLLGKNQAVDPSIIPNLNQNNISISPTKPNLVLPKTETLKCLNSDNQIFKPLPTQTRLPANSDSMYLKIFYVAVSDNGKSGKMIGCGDSIIGVPVKVGKSNSVLKISLEELLKNKNQCYSDQLYDALSGSNLKLNSVNLVSGKATIKLIGDFKSGGTCDDPRIKSQIEETAKQFPTVESVEIFINGTNIDDF